MISILNTVGDKVVFLLAGLAVRSLSWSNRSILFLSFALLARGVERVQSNTRYQLGWAIVLLGVGTTEREWGDEEKVLYTKHSRERFFIVAHRERERESEQAGSLSYMKEKRDLFFHSVHHQSLPLVLSPLPVSLDAPLVRSDQKEFANPLLEERTEKEIPLLYFSPPTNQPANKYNVFRFDSRLGGVCVCVRVSSWTFQLPSSHNIQQSTVFFPL